MIKLEEAKAELEAKSLKQIHGETAWKWASRAAAAYEAKSLDATEYESEAREHAAQVSATLVSEIINAINKYKDEN